jgi:hypothetical protein
MAALRRWVLHPFLFAIVPVAMLLTQNLAQIKPGLGLRAVLVAAALAGILLVVLRMLIQEWQKAALITSLFLIFFFTYGHIYNTIKETEIAGFLIGRHRYLGPLFVALFLAGAWWIWRRLKDTARLTEALNIIGLVALVFPVFQIVTFQLRLSSTTASPTDASPASRALAIYDGQELPDIYYIILDAYTRDDVLENVFEYDNTPFLESLEEMGFYIGYCSLSNYAQTELSLASSLNFNHLEALDNRLTPNTSDRSPLWRLINNSAVRTTLEGLGYSTVAFETGYYWTQLDDADYYLTQNSSALEVMEAVGGVNGFEVMLLNTTGALAVTDGISKLPELVTESINYPNQKIRDRLLYNFDKLDTISPEIEGPKFVFAHIVAPHEPFVFGPQGENVALEGRDDEDDYIPAYRDQLNYVNIRTLDIVKNILRESNTPPIIIIQGDHGAGPVTNEERMAILNAIHLPGGDEGLYSNISPVNNFRVIFNRFFGGELEMAEDASYYSIYDDPYNFTEVFDTRVECSGAESQ